MQEILLGLGGKEVVSYEAEFLGEVPVSEFINGTDLASQIGLTAGTAQYSDEPWLKFNLEGKTLYVAKRPFRYSIRWSQINAANAVYGDRIITIRDEQYRVRLLKGASTDPVADVTGQDPVQSWGSEWNRLFYPLVPNPTDTPTHPLSREGIRYGERANYTETELSMGNSGGNGRGTLCQESSGTQRVRRGRTGLSDFDLRTSSTTNSIYGWRPVLELVE